MYSWGLEGKTSGHMIQGWKPWRICLSVLLRGILHFWKAVVPDLSWTPRFATKHNCSILPQMTAEIKKCWYAVCLALFHFKLCIFKMTKRWNNIFWWVTSLLLCCLWIFLPLLATAKSSDSSLNKQTKMSCNSLFIFTTKVISVP